MVTLNSILESIKESPVSLEFIRARLPPKCRAVDYKALKGKHRSEVFKNTEALVVLIPKKDSQKDHFIVLLPRKKSIEYWSSLGKSPWQELELLHEPKAIFTELLGKNFNYNRTELQSGSYHINVCGAWVLLRVYFRKFLLRDFLSLFSRRITLENADDLAAIMAVMIFQDV